MQFWLSVSAADRGEPTALIAEASFARDSEERKSLLLVEALTLLESGTEAQRALAVRIGMELGRCIDGGGAALP